MCLWEKLVAEIMHRHRCATGKQQRECMCGNPGQIRAVAPQFSRETQMSPCARERDHALSHALRGREQIRWRVITEVAIRLRQRRVGEGRREAVRSPTARDSFERCEVMIGTHFSRSTSGAIRYGYGETLSPRWAPDRVIATKWIEWYLGAIAEQVAEATATLQNSVAAFTAVLGGVDSPLGVTSSEPW